MERHLKYHSHFSLLRLSNIFNNYCKIWKEFFGINYYVFFTVQFLFNFAKCFVYKLSPVNLEKKEIFN